jgi:hypothetical protein
MSRSLYWSLLAGCLGLSALTAQPAWDIACCPTPVASLSTGGCEVRLAQDSSAAPSSGEESDPSQEASSSQALALADPR